MHTTPTPRTPADVLRRGWCQGNYDNQRGAYCLLGSIFALNNGRDGTYAEWEMACEEVLGGQCAITWNDAPGRTAEEVIEAAERAWAILPDEIKVVPSPAAMVSPLRPTQPSSPDPCVSFHDGRPPVAQQCEGSVFAAFTLGVCIVVGAALVLTSVFTN